MEDQIRAAIESLAVHGEVSCVNAHAVAAKLGVAPIEVGKVVNKQTALRFYRCQLGVFGYGAKAEGKSKIVLAATNIPPDLQAAIMAQAVNGRIACKAVWEIADQFEYPRLGVANVCEALGLKMKPCQLGCF